MPRLTTPTLWRIIGPDGPVGDPGPAYVISEECSRLNDAANTDPERLRVVLYRIERVGQGMIRPDTCTWTPTDEGTDTWATRCDNLFMLSCDTPLAHGMRFCCYCGGQLVEGSADE